MAFTRTTWVDGSVPDITAAQLNRLEQGLVDTYLGRTIRGVVTAAGGVFAGAGFTASRTATGAYVVTFTVPFAVAPVVLMTVEIGAGAVGGKLEGPPSVNSVSIGTFTENTATRVDSKFHFLAMEAT
jgi:hypothetical protein